MSYFKEHSKCAICKHLDTHERDSDLHNGNAIIWYTCKRHDDIYIDEPYEQYCSEHIEHKGGKHDAAII